MTKHTPGLWTTRGHDGWYVTKEDDSGETSSWGIGPAGRPDPVAIVVHEGRYTDKEYEANGRLIAAAPTLEAFRGKIARMLPYCYEDGCENDEEHTHGGETPDGSWTDQQAEDAIATLNALIEEARSLRVEEGSEP